ncbi:MAG: hypothetical protein ABLQ96_06385, partial [Candidatus Acidiferrum sp.]
NEREKHTMHRNPPTNSIRRTAPKSHVNNSFAPPHAVSKRRASRKCAKLRPVTPRHFPCLLSKHFGRGFLLMFLPFITDQFD